MKAIRKNVRLAGVILTILMLSITVPYQSVLAAMIGTEDTLYSTRAQQARADINNLLSREDVQSALMAQGINPIEAKARTDSLSDAEVVRLADQIDKLPAGGGMVSWPWWFGPVVIGGIILLIVIFVYIGYRIAND